MNPIVAETELYELPAQLKGKPLIEALIVALAKQGLYQTMNTVEAALDQCIRSRWLDYAFGRQLDGIGRVLGLERGGYDDDLYRAWLRARIRLLRSCGTPEDIIAIADLVLDGATAIEIEEQPPAAYVLRLLDAYAWPDFTAAEFLALVDTADPAGVRLILEHHASETPFVMSDAADPTAGDGLGFGDTGDPSAGGDFASATEV